MLCALEAHFGPSGAVLARVLAYVIAGHHAGYAVSVNDAELPVGVKLIRRLG